MKFPIRKGYRGIKSGVTLDMANNNLAVITGLNGSGKTSLLMYIYENYPHRERVYFRTTSGKSNDTERYDASKWRDLPRFMRRGGETTYDDVMERIRERFADTIREQRGYVYQDDHDFYRAIFDSESSLYELRNDAVEILTKALSRFTNEEDVKRQLGIPTETNIQKEMIKQINKDLKGTSKIFDGEPQQGKKIFDKFKNETLSSEKHKRVVEIHTKAEMSVATDAKKKSRIKNHSQLESYIYGLATKHNVNFSSIIQNLSKRIYEEYKGTDKAKIVDDINTQLEENHGDFFKFTLCPPISYYESYNVNFTKRDGESGIPIEFNSLSSGEKIIFELVCYYVMGKLQTKQDQLELVILDEFDANLNPKLVDAYLGTIKRQFCNNGIRAILTTHSPTTVAKLSPSEIFELTTDETSHKLDRAHDGDSKERILRNLAPDFLYTDETQSLHYILQAKAKVLVLVEGKKDKEIFDELNLNDYDFIDCCGANNIANVVKFLKIKSINKSIKQKIVICLFDTDKQGMSGFQEVVSNMAEETKFMNKHKKGEISSIDLQIEKEEGAPIPLYATMYHPKSGSNSAWKRIRHQELKKDPALLQRQVAVIEAIIKDSGINVQEK